MIAAVGVAYAPYVDDTLGVLLPLLSTDGVWFEDVRSYAVRAPRAVDPLPSARRAAACHATRAPSTPCPPCVARVAPPHVTPPARS